MLSAFAINGTDWGNWNVSTMENIWDRRKL
jgi:hypothetical protein